MSRFLRDAAGAGLPTLAFAKAQQGRGGEFALELKPSRPRKRQMEVKVPVWGRNNQLEPLRIRKRITGGTLLGLWARSQNFPLMTGIRWGVGYMYRREGVGFMSCRVDRVSPMVGKGFR